MLETDIAPLDGQLYCQIESLNAQSDFTSSQCIRFIGVPTGQFNPGSFEQGVDAFVLDLPKKQAYQFVDHYFCSALEDCADCADSFSRWFLVRFRPSSPSDAASSGYVYRCFGGSAPAAISLVSVEAVASIRLPAFPRFLERAPPSGGIWTCSSFSVGQGMASMVYNDSHGYLIDAGAGTPIKRANYQGKTIVNELSQRVLGREVTFILSHGDEDHWRILQWDAALRNSILEFVIPGGRPRVAFFDVAVKARVKELNSHAYVPLGTGTTLTLLRTSPQVSTSNNDGVVVLFEGGGKRVLMPGDCVYSELKKDPDLAVSSLLTGVYDAVVVPHHGDHMSAHDVPGPAKKRQSVAYFAAGNHKKYKHPTDSSRREHRRLGYVNVVNKLPAGIVERIF